VRAAIPKFKLKQHQQFQKSKLCPKEARKNPNSLQISDTPDIQGIIGQLTGKEQNLKQMNEGYEDNAEEEEDEQTDDAALFQNKDYRVNLIAQPPIQENLGSLPQNNQGLNALNQMDKDNTNPAAVGIQEKPKKGKGSKQTKLTEGLIASNEQSQSSNTQIQTQTASTVPKIKAMPKRGSKKPKQVKHETKISNYENEGEQSL
ncbi:MAG: hypothetical protein EZS28_033421, partial [Streblomastix strix]